MTEERMRTLKVGRKIGALLGGIVFVVFGIVPGFYFGSAATVILLSHLAGGPVEPGVLVRMLIVVGTVLGLFCTASVSIVGGSALGTGLAYVADLIKMPAREPEKATAESK